MSLNSPDHLKAIAQNALLEELGLTQSQMDALNPLRRAAVAFGKPIAPKHIVRTLNTQQLIEYNKQVSSISLQVDFDDLSKNLARKSSGNLEFMADSGRNLKHWVNKIASEIGSRVEHNFSPQARFAFARSTAAGIGVIAGIDGLVHTVVPKQEQLVAADGSITGSKGPMRKRALVELAAGTAIAAGAAIL